MNQKQIIEKLEETLLRRYGCHSDTASPQQIYRCLCYLVNEMLVEKNTQFNRKTNKDQDKQVYYMSMEFLVGTSLRNNLYNLGLEELFTQALDKCGIDIHDLYEMEPDAGLGNGGLGRLASCYMDSATTLGIPCTGYSIRYEFGIFKQKIIDGWQMEFPDDWLTMGDVWLVPREDEAVEVKFGGEAHGWDDNGKYRVAHVNYQSVMAVPNDMYISGHDTDAVNKLVLWSAKSPRSFDMTAFSRGDYAKALEGDTMAEVISKVLYPADDHIAGKRLRLRQQYLLVSASLQTILRKHLKTYRSLDNLADKVSIHINDTHPALCVPELMRLLLDEYDYGWDEAWKITCNTLSYTNHTVMSEALERWSESLFSEQMPRVYQIVCEINRRLVEDLRAKYGNDMGKINYMAVIANGEIRMANLCLAACHKINGVSKLHTEILKDSIFRDYYQMEPNRFLNVTNGIAYRRWLCQSNPDLSALLKELIGDGFVKDSRELEKLLKYRDDASVLSRLQEIKLANKQRLSDLILQRNGIQVDPNSLFDVQIKRLHEYKRQFLNILAILELYYEIAEGSLTDFTPTTFIFGAKSAPGYARAKGIIKLINEVAALIDRDDRVRGKIKVAFLSNYNVSYAEKIIAAADVSEQISTAGKEASGTGNMKLMANGAVTLGTLDGANIEIVEEAGSINEYIFGATVDEIRSVQEHYNPNGMYHNDYKIKRVLDALVNGTLNDGGSGIFRELHDSIVYGASWHRPDQYFLLLDFERYLEAKKQVARDYKDQLVFAKKRWMNICNSGKFSSDRTIREYAKDIWHIEEV